MTDSLPGAAPTDAQLLDAYVAGCNAESVLTHDAELSPPNVRKGIAAAMRFALRGAALEAGPDTAVYKTAPEVNSNPVSDALALIRRALAMRNYGDKPVLWEQVWRDIEDAALRLGNALGVGGEERH